MCLPIMNLDSFRYDYATPAEPPPAFSHMEDRTGRSIVFQHEKTEVNNEQFIKPNEKASFLFKKALSLVQETVIAVGAIRTLVAFTLGSSERAILLDISESICKFNRLHLQLIQEIGFTSKLSLLQQRNLYIDAMHNPSLSRAESSPKISESFPLEERNHGLKQSATSIPKNIQLLIAKMATLLDRTNVRSFHEIAPFSEFEHGEDPCIYYWEDDQKWSKLVSAIRQKKISVVQGDLAGDLALRSIATGLSSFDEKVGAIDVSNALDWFTPEDVERFIANIKKLPLAFRPILLFTCNKNKELDLEPLGKSMDQWNYYCLSLDNPEIIHSISGRSLAIKT